jgi:glutamate--cysteine ligase
MAFDRSTYFYPYATSLRMGDIGYQNSLEEGRGFKANYDSLNAYVRSLTWAIETPCPENELIGVQENGEYKQLNANVLQIENEHYSTIRPKQITQWMEKPTLALRRRGVRYVELRSLDVNPFHPLGVSEEQLDFLETFLVFCLLNESPRISATEAKAIDANQILVAHSGREPGLVLNRGGRKVNVRTWGTELLEAMLPVAEMLENETSGGRYCAVLRQQLELLANPELTPSALMLEQMREHREGFFDFASRMSLRHRDYYSGLAQDPERQAFFEREARESLARQEALEQDDRQSFPEFLESYFLQK